MDEIFGENLKVYNNPRLGEFQDVLDFFGWILVLFI